jgi:hypothetical protein
MDGTGKQGVSHGSGGMGRMTGRFIYEFEGVTFSSIYWADIYKAMLNDARHIGAGVYCEVCICGHHSYCLRVMPDGSIYRIYTHLRGGRNGAEERVLPVRKEVC